MVHQSLNLPPQVSRLGTQPRPSSQGWASSPAPVLKAGHPALPQFSRLGTQPRPRSQGWAPSPAPGLKAGHPALPQFSRLGTQPRPSSQGWAPRVLLSCFSVLYIVSSVFYVYLRFFLFFFLQLGCYTHVFSMYIRLLYICMAGYYGNKINPPGPQV